MKYRGQFPLFSLLLLLVGPVLALAQVIDCPSIVRTALAATDEFCGLTGRNQACYGNITLEAEPQAGVADFQFDEPGDVVDVAQVKRLRLSPLDEQQRQWGVALMRIQANVPDTLPGQNVTFLLFGDVEIRNTGQANIEPATLEVTALRAVVVYEQPLENSSILAGIIANEKIVVDGQTSDNVWLRVRLPNDGSKYGWILNEDVTGEGIKQLPVIDFEQEVVEDGTQSFRPMQAFYFKTGFHDRPCAEAPDSGILIQAPENAGPIELRVNEVDITLGSTAYLQAQPDGEMTISVIEGAALVEANGEARAVPAGTQVRVPIDESLQISGQPSQTEPYDTNSLQILPVQHLDIPVVVTAALSFEQIESLSKPRVGVWQQASNVIRLCQDGTLMHDFWEPEEIAILNVYIESFSVHSSDYVIQFARTGTEFSYYAQLNYLGHILVRYEYKVISPDRIIGKLIYTQDDCAYNISREIIFVRAGVS